MRPNPAVRRLFAALGAALVLAGCTHVHPADLTAAGVDLGRFNAGLVGQVVRVNLVDGTDLLAHEVAVSADSVFMRPQVLREASWWVGSSRALPTSDVRSIEVTRRGRGALDGTFVGLGIGVVAGVLLGASQFEPDNNVGMSRGDYEFVAGVYLGAVGTVAGLLIGACVGSTDVYDLTKVPAGAGPGLVRK